MSNYAYGKLDEALLILWYNGLRHDGYVGMSGYIHASYRGHCVSCI